MLFNQKENSMMGVHAHLYSDLYMEDRHMVHHAGNGCIMLNGALVAGREFPFMIRTFQNSHISSQMICLALFCLMNVEELKKNWKQNCEIILFCLWCLNCKYWFTCWNDWFCKHPICTSLPKTLLLTTAALVRFITDFPLSLEHMMINNILHIHSLSRFIFPYASLHLSSFQISWIYFTELKCRLIN